MNWEQIKQLEDELQINAINELLEKYPHLSLGKIETEILSITKGIVSNYMKRKGYKMVNDGNKRYYSNETHINSNKDITHSNVDSSNKLITVSAESIPSDNKITTTNNKIKLYIALEKYLLNNKDKKMVAKTIKVSENNEVRIKSFLENNLLLNKQDLINISIEMFLDKFE